MGKTWRDLAAFCNVGDVTISKWRDRSAFPTLDKGLDIAEFLGYRDTRKIAERVR